MRKLLLLGLALGLAACSTTDNKVSSSSGSGGSSGGGSSGSSGTTGGQTLNISGTVELHPVVAALEDAGLYAAPTPSFAGQTLFIDEPLIAIIEGPESGRLASTTLDASGAFNAQQVPTDRVQIGLVGTMASDSPDGGFQSCETDAGAPAFCSGWARGVTLLWEDWQNNKPSGDITGARLYGVPVSLVEVLSQKLGLAANEHLLDKGFVLGYVLDAQGQPVSGVTFTTSNNNFQVAYLDDNLNPGASGTNKYGMFLIIAPGQPDPTHTFGITGHPEMKCHSVGSNPGTVLSLVWDANHPGIDCR